MNLAQLKAAGAYITAEPVTHEIRWKDQTFNVHIRRMAYAEVEAIMNAEGSKNAALVAASVLLGEDLEPITTADVERFDPQLVFALVAGINKVNGTSTGEAGNA